MGWRRGAVNGAAKGAGSLLKRKMCEGCKSKHPSFGIKGDGPDDGKIRWCLGCSKNHKDAVRLSKAHKMCEKCNNKTSNFGIPAEANGDGKRRWCGACAKKHRGSVSKRSQVCPAHPDYHSTPAPSGPGAGAALTQDFKSFTSL